jgi:CarD family transcriptional regulator
MFKVGDLAVYPAQGVGRIEAIETREIAGQKQDFYIMKILENNMTIMIPVNNVESVGVRDIIDDEEVAKVYAIMKKRDIPADNQTWNRRYREYMEKIKTGSLYEVAEVLRDLYLLKVDKELSFGERKMLDTAQSLLLKELSIAKKTDENAIMSDIKAIFNLE